MAKQLAYARRLVLAGVPTELHVYPGAFHGFEAAPQGQLAATAREDAIAALRRALHPGPTM